MKKKKQLQSWVLLGEDPTLIGPAGPNDIGSCCNKLATL